MSGTTFAGSDLTCEIAEFSIDLAHLDDFKASAEAALAVILGQPTVHGGQFVECIEEPGKFLLVVVWDSVAAHEAFRASEDFPVYRGHIQDYFVVPPRALHYRWTAGPGALIDG